MALSLVSLPWGAAGVGWDVRPVPLEREECRSSG